MQKKKLSKKGKIAAVGDRAPGSLLGRARRLAWPLFPDGKKAIK